MKTHNKAQSNGPTCYDLDEVATELESVRLAISFWCFSNFCFKVHNDLGMFFVSSPEGGGLDAICPASL